MEAPRVRVDEGSTLLFHSTPQLWARAVVARPELFTDEDRRIIATDLSWVEAALTARGVSSDLLSCIDNATQPRISDAVRIQSDGSPVRIPYSYAFVWLSPEVLRGFGVAHIDLNWTLLPSSRDSYEALKGLDIAWVDTLADCGLAPT